MKLGALAIETQSADEQFEFENEQQIEEAVNFTKSSLNKIPNILEFKNSYLE